MHPLAGALLSDIESQEAIKASPYKVLLVCLIGFSRPSVLLLRIDVCELLMTIWLNALAVIKVSL